MSSDTPEELKPISLKDLAINLLIADVLENDPSPEEVALAYRAICEKYPDDEEDDG